MTNQKENKSMPTDVDVRDAFHATADAISGDLFGLSVDDVGEFRMDRDTIMGSLSTYGYHHVSEWVFSLSPNELNKELDRMRIPQYWVE